MAKAKSHLCARVLWGCPAPPTHGQMKGRAEPQAKINYGKITSSWAKWPLFVWDWDCETWIRFGVSPCMWNNNMRWILFLQIFHSNSFCELAFKPSSPCFSILSLVVQKKEEKNCTKTGKMSWNLNASTGTWCTRLWRTPSTHRLAVTVTALSGLILPPTSSASFPGFSTPCCRCMRYAWVEPMWPFRLMYTEHVAC